MILFIALRELPECSYLFAIKIFIGFESTSRLEFIHIQIQIKSVPFGRAVCFYGLSLPFG